jgi:large subunit ribosomal protein L4
MVGILDNLKANKPLIVTAGQEDNLWKSSRNIPGVAALEVAGLNVYDILAHDHLVITKDAVAKVEEALA